eukprot:CAMPEP_0175079278 /NCGR_PEP_ID=MMETSP0052_2-20121109/24727_1 /TAXON_ID=51329 ORGANISM="Polytomella parva, Strain SAG 63-3" /NCGR_SAMPLE_ID=MMETSP0052_2 /ASSEMBLY_ACC=CAM_ASM_000194 /LENGTH=259 /DNA_ID=CAMNT_0016349577 /DNA_START=27 /DNA_END=806 /DNA_ORIENTATION=+
MSKKAKIEEPVEEVEEEVSVSEEIRAKIESIREELDEVNKEADAKILEVARSFEQKRLPLYKKRNEVFKSIEKFWQKTLKNHLLVRANMTDDDDEALGFCEEVLVEEIPGSKDGFMITFRFKNSPFFSNTELVKSINYSADGPTTYVIKGADIKWKKGYEPAKEEETKSTKGKKRAAAAEASTREYIFFDWLSTSEEEEDGERDRLGEIIHEEIWEDPLQYYLGEVDNEDEDEEGEDEGEFEEGEESGEGEESEQGEDD